MIMDVKTFENQSYEGRVYFPLFHKEILVYIDKGVPMDYAHLCAKALAELDDKVIEDLCQSAIFYCEDFCEDIGADIPTFNQPRDVLKMIEPNVLLISKPKDTQVPLIHIEGNCDWEIEHGIEFIIRNHQLLYLAEFSSVDAWAEMDYYEDDFNYAYRRKKEKI